MTNGNAITTSPTFRCLMEPSKIERIATVLQAGFYRPSKTGNNLYSFLETLPGFDKDYIYQRLQTIFLDGDAVDDLQTIFTQPSATLALSAAMPGLAGAIYRKQSPHASLRKTPANRTTSQTVSEVNVKVKFFNVIAVEKGPGVLQQGTVINSDDLISFLKLRPSIIESMKDLEYNDQPADSSQLLSMLPAFNQVTLICKPDNGKS